MIFVMPYASEAAAAFAHQCRFGLRKRRYMVLLKRTILDGVEFAISGQIIREREHALCLPYRVSLTSTFVFILHTNHI